MGVLMACKYSVCVCYYRDEHVKIIMCHVKKEKWLALQLQQISYNM